MTNQRVSGVLSRMDSAIDLINSRLAPPAAGPGLKESLSLADRIQASAVRQRNVMAQLKPIGEPAVLPPLCKPLDTADNRPLVNNHYPVGVARHSTQEEFDADASLDWFRDEEANLAKTTNRWTTKQSLAETIKQQIEQQKQRRDARANVEFFA